MIFIQYTYKQIELNTTKVIPNYSQADKDESRIRRREFWRKRRENPKFVEFKDAEFEIWEERDAAAKLLDIDVMYGLVEDIHFVFFHFHDYHGKF